ncbi:MAG: hypothetical protein ABI473_00585 [Candidatus Dormibacter sp.]
MERLRAMRPGPQGRNQVPLPDPAKPPANRGGWDEAALTNVEITELVKRQIRTNTLPWQK